MFTEEKIARMPIQYTKPEEVRTRTPQAAKRKRYRVGHELSKAGMIVSLTTVVLTGLRVLRPMMPLHPISGMALIGFAIWHIYQKDQRVVHSKTRSGRHS